MRLFAFSLPLLLALTVSAHQYQKPFGQLQEEQKYKDYTVKIYRSDFSGFGDFEILRSGKQIYFQKGLIFMVGSPYSEDATNILMKMGLSILGDKQPNLIISEINGGNNSLCDFYIFQIGDTFKPITKIKRTGIGFGTFKDLRGDGILDLVTYDELTFNYWHCGGADSPHPSLILRYQNHEYRLDLEKMKEPAPTRPELEKMGKGFKAKFAGVKKDMEDDNWSAPYEMWGEMLDLIYSGNMKSAWELCDLSWPKNHPGKAAFLKEFIKRLQTSKYYEDLNQPEFQGVVR